MFDEIRGAEVQVSIDKLIINNSQRGGPRCSKAGATAWIPEHQHHPFISFRNIIRDDRHFESHGCLPVSKGQGAVGGTVVLPGGSRAIEGKELARYDSGAAMVATTGDGSIGLIFVDRVSSRTE